MRKKEEAVKKLWPELEWIKNDKLRGQVLQTWIKALDESPLTAEDLETVPFTLLIPDCKVTFMNHKRCVVNIVRQGADMMRVFLGENLTINMDFVVAGAILCDVGKLLEYEIIDGKLCQSERGKNLRHPFTGVYLAMSCGVPDAVCHIIATHAGEGNLGKRSPEAWIVHHADFMAYDALKG